MFPFALVPVLMPFLTHRVMFLTHRGILDIVAGGDALLVATGVHLLWEVIAFGTLQESESWKSDPKRPLVYGQLPLGVKLRWFAVDATLSGWLFSCLG